MAMVGDAASPVGVGGTIVGVGVGGEEGVTRNSAVLVLLGENTPVGVCADVGEGESVADTPKGIAVIAPPECAAGIGRGTRTSGPSSPTTITIPNTRDKDTTTIRARPFIADSPFASGGRHSDEHVSDAVHHPRLSRPR